MKEYTNSDITKIIDEFIHSRRDREILKARYIEGLTYENLSENFELSVTQIKRIIYKNEDIIFKHL